MDPIPSAVTTVTLPSDRELVITRTFDAPRRLIFAALTQPEHVRRWAWTDPTHLARWWSPKGFTNSVCEVDARPGGAIFIVMRGPDGAEYSMKGVFREVVEPERLVMLASALEDADGTPRLEVLNTVTFVEQEGATTLPLHTVVLKAGPDGAWALAGMAEGWGQSLDKLADLLAGA